jgi:hypothetical protein
MRTVFAFLVAAAATPAAAPAHAQLINQPGGASMASVVGIHAFFIVEGERMFAKKSFDAVLADSSKSTLVFNGGGVEVTRLWKGLFARVAATRSRNEGSRVFVDSAGNATSLNVPVTIELTPIEVGGGWRFANGRERHLIPYVGAAVLAQHYRETSEGASAEENTDTTDVGQSIFGGLELAFGFVSVGVEGQLRNVPNTLGAAGVSEAYNEKNLGGSVIRVTFGVGF